MRWLKGLAFDAFTRPLQLITTCYLLTKLLSPIWLLVIIYHYLKESESGGIELYLQPQGKSFETCLLIIHKNDYADQEEIVHEGEEGVP